MNHVGGTQRHLGLEGLQDYLSAGAPAAVSIVGEPPAMLIIEPRIETVGVRMPWDGEAPPDLSDYENLRTDVVIDRGLAWVEVRVHGKNILSDAYPLLCAVVDRVQIDRLSFGQAVQEVLSKYHDLLSRSASMGDDREIGLYGELLALEHLTTASVPTGALEAWRGPYREEHDFSLQDGDVEVKTTTAHSRTHWISALEQLEPNTGRSLWLLSIQLVNAGDGPGRTLPHLVETIRGNLSHGENRQVFDSGLVEVGWQDEQAGLYTTKFRLRSRPLAFRVDRRFPAITQRTLKAGGTPVERVQAIRYQLNLSGLAPDPTGPDGFRSFTSGGDTQ